MLVRSSFKWVPPPAPVQVNRPILTPADLNNGYLKRIFAVALIDPGSNHLQHFGETVNCLFSSHLEAYLAELV